MAKIFTRHVLVEEEQHAALKRYAEMTGVPIGRAVREVLEEFINFTLPERLERLSRK